MSFDPHETFNARNYTFEEVADRFVPTGDFARVAAKHHSVLLGPRGSGKTTLFKMLTLTALHRWQDSRSEAYRTKLPFYAVYIPSDILWHHQLEYIEKNLVEAPVFQKASSRAAVITNIFQSLIETFQGILRKEVPVNTEAEIELCKFIIEQWQLGPTLPDLSTIQISLEGRMANIRTLLNRVVDHQYSDEDMESLPDWYYYDFLPKLGVVCSKISQLFSLSKSRWALCFDELELAPVWLQEELFEMLRSTDQRFLFKLSASPIPRILGRTTANQLDDFKLVRMWPHSSNKYRHFCDDLTKRLLSDRFNCAIDTESLFDSAHNRGNEDYSEGTENWALLKRAATWDRSFVKFLKGRQPPVDPTNPVPDSIDQCDRVHRKAKPILRWREAYLKQGKSGRLQKRSRKGAIPELFSGFDAIYSVTDGNPRRVIAIASRLADHVRFDKYDRVRLIPYETQAEILHSFSNQYSAYIKTIPDAYFTGSGKTISLFELLKDLGSYFHQQVCGNEFHLDPYGSFIIDEWLPEELLEVLRSAAWHGAIVHIDADAKKMDSRIQGKRFRLSFSLAPSFGLLMSKHRPKGLAACSSILTSGRKRKAEVTHITDKNQPDLFDE